MGRGGEGGAGRRGPGGEGIVPEGEYGPWEGGRATCSCRENSCLCLPRIFKDEACQLQAPGVILQLGNPPSQKNTCTSLQSWVAQDSWS